LRTAGIYPRHRDRFVDRGDGYSRLLIQSGRPPRRSCSTAWSRLRGCSWADDNTSLPHTRRPKPLGRPPGGWLLPALDLGHRADLNCTDHLSNLATALLALIGGIEIPLLMILVLCPANRVPTRVGQLPNHEAGRVWRRPAAHQLPQPFKLRPRWVAAAGNSSRSAKSGCPRRSPCMPGTHHDAPGTVPPPGHGRPVAPESS